MISEESLGSSPTRFKSKSAKQTPDRGNEDDSDDNEIFHDARFPPDEEEHLLTQSKAQKTHANKLFSSGSYSEAITTYDRALSFCPNYLDYEIAVLRSNIAACHLKLEDWKAAADAATTSLEYLNRLLPSHAPADVTGESQQSIKKPHAENSVVEIDAADEDDVTEQLKTINEDDSRREDIKRIRAKALMRRARAKMELGGWANLQGAQSDYQELLKLNILPQRDELIALGALRELPARIDVAKEKELGDMMGKLKDLGNGILRPFGLSTDNFKFVQDEKTGGYNIAFEQ